jgi:hypothetical protein
MLKAAKRWYRKQKAQEEEPDPLDAYITSFPPPVSGIRGNCIVVGNETYYPNDPTWPGNRVAREISQLYELYIVGPGNPKPRRYERLAGELLAAGQRRMRRKRT